ncbi:MULTISPECIES: NUDIX hydrolase N-terminal domain-containing protein [unclassified Enterococcus]|uniref:NUDIX hydrolase N-terminal domain-containing protein n=1 Tax=unclassified Enterococcus TaxID=2608891 RepID=UPI0015581EB3|nr:MULTISPECIES: NUDIX hydrolase N-terminal domain-containing protein [unclassified Enterococcus]MBS7577041.1 NUDIX hydrolase N-terminal domain-containing protein [Enterococcus sp. MMGLQ5-2]MBS7584512.1 NUDIX hydrolase N-terminal domain-containing protein [Enterococcus sp. MMGLQ5-1]NPD12367.1 NUDIX domain-containing protein [Enterococcus sp. MMGLQ5-1]NPD36875.1 NUDIX domain-containing protein [Enterococcus sp. MMGLQ5-2]
MEQQEVAKMLQRMNAIVNAGLIYGHDSFDQARYHEFKQLLAELLVEQSGLSLGEVDNFLRPTAWYPTPLIDVRAVVVRENRILLVQSAIDGKWSLPGGYAEVGTSPKENVLKELKEESGLEGEVLRLLAIFDSNSHQLQGQQYYKMFFACAAKGGQFTLNAETVAAQYFPINNLPDLSLVRNTAWQIERCHQVWLSAGEAIID